MSIVPKVAIARANIVLIFAFGRDVALAGEGVRPGGADELNHCIGGRLVDYIVDDHICAGGTQSDRDGAAYA